MEVPQWVYSWIDTHFDELTVLILILMEVPQWVNKLNDWIDTHFES